METSRDSTGNGNRKSPGGSAPTNCWREQQRQANQPRPQPARSHNRSRHDRVLASRVIAVRACADAVKKRRVLLVDASQTEHELRADVMRKLGMDVDCAADTAEVRSWWRAALCDLALINAQRWRILETSRRISAVRSASLARTQAMRAFPDPPRDSEGRPAKPTATQTSGLSQRERYQAYAGADAFVRPAQRSEACVHGARAANVFTATVH